ncbi:MAG: 50S ribosomal protein L23 [bacterium JZ-2024 1]
MNIPLTEVLRKPVISEKSLRYAEMGVYTFLVHPNATKIQVKQAVEKLFQVKVEKVRVVHVFPKQRMRFGRRAVYRGKTSGKKKAYIQLKPGYSLPKFFETG